MRCLAILPLITGAISEGEDPLRPHAGLPIFTHVLRSALHAEAFDTVQVVTDTSRVAQLAQHLGFLVRLVPTAPPNPASPMEAVHRVLEPYRAASEGFDALCMLNPFAVWLTAQDLASAVRLFASHGGSRPVVGVTPTSLPDHLLFHLQDDGGLVRALPQNRPALPLYRELSCFRLHSLHAPPSAAPLGLVLPPWKEPETRVDFPPLRLEPPFPPPGSPFATPLQRLNRQKNTAALWLEGGGMMRLLHPDDVDEGYVAGLNDPDVHRYMVAPRQQRQTLELVQAYVAMNLRADDAILFGLFVKERLRGTLRLHDITEHGATMGIALFDKSIWGQGWGGRMIRAACDFAFSGLGLAHIHAGIEPENIASRRVFSKAGFFSIDGHTWEMYAGQCTGESTPMAS